MFFCIKMKKAAYGILSAMLTAAIVFFSIRAIFLSNGAVSAFYAFSHTEEVFVPVIMYHSILDGSSRSGDYVLDKKVFEADMEYLQKNGYTSVFVSDLINYVDGKGDLPEKPVVITFDDGYYNIMTYAYPYMKEHGIKGVVSIVGAYTDLSAEHDEHNPAYSNLTWEEIAELNQSGVFEIGNHTYNMHEIGCRSGCKMLYNESVEEYRHQLLDDIGMLQGLLEDKSGVKPVVFAYPFGFISDESVEILQEMGFRALLTSYEKPNFISPDNPDCLLCINRYNRPSGISTQEFMEKALSQ